MSTIILDLAVFCAKMSPLNETFLKLHLYIVLVIGQSRIPDCAQNVVISREHAYESSFM